VLGTLAVRAIGRALGIGNAADPSDPMYPCFNGVKLCPSASDIAAFRAVEEWYVARKPDLLYSARAATRSRNRVGAPNRDGGRRGYPFTRGGSAMSAYILAGRPTMHCC